MDAVAMLKAAVEDIDLPAMSVGVPSVNPALLHPWFAASVATLWNDGHHREAVQTAARMIEIQLKDKLSFDGAI